MHATSWRVQVALLDAKNRSYIARHLLATTHGDGALGSDIFHPTAEAAACENQVTRWIRAGLATAHRPANTATVEQVVQMAAETTHI